MSSQDWSTFGVSLGVHTPGQSHDPAHATIPSQTLGTSGQIRWFNFRCRCTSPISQPLNAQEIFRQLGNDLGPATGRYRFHAEHRSSRLPVIVLSISSHHGG